MKYRFKRNEGIVLDKSFINSMKINKSAVDRRALTLPTRRSIKNAYQAAWLLKAISCLDLTTLSGDDTATNVRRLCAKAKQPVRIDILSELGMENENITVGAVCVYHNMIKYATEALDGTGIPIAAVSTGFPAGNISLTDKLRQIKASIKAGAKEIDIVISRELVIGSQWTKLYNEVKACREACGEAHMKTILATGEIPTYTKVAQASWVCMAAGSDFIKTSTGKESVNATLAVSLVMVRCIREYHELTGIRVGFKPAGGIRTAKDAIKWLLLIKEELGDDWLHADLFRFGASSLLTDIERQLDHYVTGRYSNYYRHPMA